MGPYGIAAPVLWGLGWRGLLPLPPGRKHPPPEGWTGATAPMPRWPDVYAWMEDRADHNIGVRLPDTMIGLDVDGYGGKLGAETFGACLDRWGPLPDTVIVTSRTDGISGIRLYGVPSDMHWPGELGSGLEIIQSRHRYVVFPSSAHPEGRIYGYLYPGADELSDVHPSVESIVALPDPWVEGITRGRLAIDLAKVAVGQEAAGSWFGQLPEGPLCRDVARALTHTVLALGSATGSRHDLAVRAVMHLCRLGSEGHIGVRAALLDIEQAWMHAVTADGSRSESAARAEWLRMLTGPWVRPWPFRPGECRPIRALPLGACCPWAGLRPGRPWARP